MKCASSGITVDGSRCDCTSLSSADIPIVLDIPKIYQTVEFSKELLPIKMDSSYGFELQRIIEEVKANGSYHCNTLICSPPNTGKTILAYTIFRHMFLKGLKIPPLMDLSEVKSLLSYTYSQEDNIKREIFLNSTLAVIKIPSDVPNKFAEIMHTIIEKRVRRNGTTIFLFGGPLRMLKSRDPYKFLNNIIRDGSYNSLKVIDAKYHDDEVIKENAEALQSLSSLEDLKYD